MMPSSLHFTIHRAANAIGGNCIELADADGQRILLDIGRPLDATDNDDDKALLPKTLDLSKPCDGVLISHAHPDHYGLLNAIPANWPVWCGAATEQLIRITHNSTRKPAPVHKFNHWQSGGAFSVGPFRVTPMLTDHSAFDAHMLLIEAHGRSVLYSGDFRRHGRKGWQVEKLMNNPPAGLDALIMEGTNFFSDKVTVSEEDLQRQLAALFKQTKGRVFITTSSQNIDRVTSTYKACLKTKRTLMVDLYAAEILDVLATHARIPRPGYNNLRTVIVSRQKKGRTGFVSKVIAAGVATSFKALAAQPAETQVIMFRDSQISLYEKAGLLPTAQDVWCWSLWNGYLKNESSRKGREWFGKHGCPMVKIHTSGHAAESDLRAFAAALNARHVIPVHGDKWDKVNLPNLCRAPDGKPIAL